MSGIKCPSAISTDARSDLNPGISTNLMFSCVNHGLLLPTHLRINNRRPVPHPSFNKPENNKNSIYERITGSDSVEGHDQACHRGALLHPDSLQHRTSHEQCTEEVGLRHQGAEGKQHEDQRQKAEGNDCSFCKDPPLHTKWKIKTIMQTRSS